MIVEAFLACALAVPPSSFHQPFGKAEVEVFKLLRDYPNGQTGSRPAAWALIYGKHPLWTFVLNDHHIKTVGMWRQKLSWPNYIVGDPVRPPFKTFQFQIYLFDDLEPPQKDLGQLILEASRITRPWGFFLFRPILCPNVGSVLQFFGWSKFDFTFHDFQIWHRREYLENVRASSA